MSPGDETLSECFPFRTGDTVTINSGTYIIRVGEAHACGNYAKLLKAMTPSYWFDGKEFHTLKEMNDYKAAYNSKNAIKFMKQKNFRK